ncbi:hypothetical protein [Amycolatopsis decaplanina]|uniref:Uncharacterized protein n=1 Tax=Amycolatopsis decaplanina DSM 44594 TaxID=1284240 RepID=M2ZGU0_9PSEU|nr:hypothetical protein [Amycolatopsis decaplanina]EME60098.1 hypothetical protein H074_13762 [Amycolatopsis decaplanina DSM 44594]
MAADYTGLLDELRALRKGRGVFSAEITQRIGPTLRELCRIQPDDQAPEIREKLLRHLSDVAASLPADLRVAASAAVALHPAARHRFLTGRITWLAQRIGRDERTVRRRMDDGIAQLAEVAARCLSAPPPPPDNDQSDFHVEQFSAVLILDRGAPEALERRTIVAERDDLDQIVVALSLPTVSAAENRDRDLAAEVLYGGTLLRRRRPVGSRFEFVLTLPRPLRAGERHEYGMRYRIPEGQAMREHYVYTSPRRCGLFDLRVRFGLVDQPLRIWRVEEVFHRDLDEEAPTGDILLPDKAGELRVVFRDLLPGFGYGVQWTMP